MRAHALALDKGYLMCTKYSDAKSFFLELLTGENCSGLNLITRHSCQTLLLDNLGI